MPPGYRKNTMKANNEITLEELASIIGGELQGDGNKTICGMNSLEDAAEDEVGFLANDKYSSQVKTTSAAAVIVAIDYDGPGDTLIRCKDPYFAFREAMVALYGFRKPGFEKISPQAIIDPSAITGNDVAIAGGVTISKNVVIADRTVLYPGVYIGPNCRIGEDCTLYPNTVLYDGTILGDRVTIHACTSIGQDGFGYSTHAREDGVVVHDKIPQVGRVILEDDVEIGACCAIERASMGDTVVGAGTKFADLIAIGHGTRLGKHCLLVSQAGIAGSTTIGNYCVFAGQAGVVGHIKIGDNVRVGAKAGVTNNIESGTEVLGAPALPLSRARKIIMSTLHTPEMRKTIKILEKEIGLLKDRINQLENDNG